LHLRLQSKVATSTSKVKDPVEAIVIAPVVVGGEFLIPAGTTVHGTVEAVKASTKPDERATLGLKFSTLDINGQKVNMAAKVTSVENAREIVDDQGQIQGILASDTISARLDSGINRLAQRYGGLADMLGAAKGAILKSPEADIGYET